MMAMAQPARPTPNQRGNRPGPGPYSDDVRELRREKDDRKPEQQDNHSAEEICEPHALFLSIKDPAASHAGGGARTGLRAACRGE